MQQDGVVYCMGGGIRNYVIVRAGSQLGFAVKFWIAAYDCGDAPRFVL